MDRRQWLRGAALIAAGALAADQLELVERLTHKRRLFSGWTMPTLHGDGIHDDWPAMQALFDGKLVRRPTGEIMDGSGNFYLNGTGQRFVLSRTVRGNFPGQTGRGVVANCYIDGRPPSGGRLESIFLFHTPLQARIA